MPCPEHLGDLGELHRLLAGALLHEEPLDMPAWFAARRVAKTANLPQDQTLYQAILTYLRVAAGETNK